MKNIYSKSNLSYNLHIWILESDEKFSCFFNSEHGNYIFHMFDAEKRKLVKVHIGRRQGFLLFYTATPLFFRDGDWKRGALLGAGSKAQASRAYNYVDPA